MRAFFDRIEANRFAVAGVRLADLDASLVAAMRRARIVLDGEAGEPEVSPAGLVATLRRLYAIASHGVALPSVLDDRPVLLGWTGRGAEEREVVLVPRPSVALGSALGRPFRCLVLVPTARELSPTRRRRHGPGAFLEVEALEESLSVAKGRLVRVVPAARARVGARAASPGSGRAHLAGAVRWNQVRVCLVDQTLVRVDLPDRSVRCAPADFGMVNPRSRKPTVLWEALVTLCEEHGHFKTTRFGSAEATKKVISRLRARLREAFALQAPPFRRYQSGVGWRTHFDARPDLPEDGTSGEGGLRDWVQLRDKSVKRYL
ncbi:MAG TPA: hypothetical protein VGL81_19465 [Polyangiaceae bacterium]|jgi:hypothetical protein